MRRLRSYKLAFRIPSTILDGANCFFWQSWDFLKAAPLQLPAPTGTKLDLHVELSQPTAKMLGIAEGPPKKLIPRDVLAEAGLRVLILSSRFAENRLCLHVARFGIFQRPRAACRLKGLTWSDRSPFCPGLVSASSVMRADARFVQRLD